MTKLISLLCLSLIITNVSISQERYSKKDIKKMKLEDGVYANMSTNKGDILLKLEHEKTPLTVANFVGLSEGNFKNDTIEISKPFYDGLVFHRVIPNFMIQGGCPLGNGTGSPGYKFQDEFDSTLTHSGPGILSMANSGPSTNGSQFFITHKDTPWLNGKHTVFGNVVKGLDVVNAIAQNDTIIHIEIYRYGKSAKKFKATETFESTLAAIEKARKEELAIRNTTFREKMIKTYPTAIQTESGLMYVEDKAGEGENAKNGNTVKVHYTGFFTNGKKFDSSLKKGVPLEFVLGQKRVIGGWDEGIALMNKGAKYTLIVPYWLAYGERGYPNIIPPKSTLIFDVELVSFK